MKHQLCLLVVCLSLVGCGDALPITAPASVVGATNVLAATSPAPRFTTSSVEACDALDYSGPFYPTSEHGGSVDLQWQETPCAVRGYAVEVYRRGAGDVYSLVAATTVPEHLASLLFSNGGSYYARVRALGRGDSFGPWTDPAIYFSVDEPESASAAVEVIITPGDEGGGNGHNGGGNGGGNTDHDCHIHSNSGNHGTPSGDHNNDGHHDCGIGHS